MKRRVIRSPAAERDAIEIWLHIGRDSPAAADRVIEDIDRAILRLEGFAQSGVARHEIGLGLRQIVVAPYLIFYRVRSDDAVEIVRIVHGARDLHDL